MFNFTSTTVDLGLEIAGRSYAQRSTKSECKLVELLESLIANHQQFTKQTSSVIRSIEARNEYFTVHLDSEYGRPAHYRTVHGSFPKRIQVKKEDPTRRIFRLHVVVDSRGISSRLKHSEAEFATQENRKQMLWLNRSTRGNRERWRSRK